MKNVSTLTKFVFNVFMALIIFGSLDALFNHNQSSADRILIIAFAITWALDRDEQKKEAANGKAKT